MDVVLAVGIGALQLFGTALAAQNQPDARPLDVLAVLLLGGGALALIARRRYPVAVFAFAFVTTFSYELLDYPGGPIWGTLIVAFVHGADHRSPARRLRRDRARLHERVVGSPAAGRRASARRSRSPPGCWS